MATRPEPQPAERAFWSWIGFWVQFLLLGICIVLGAFAASRAKEPSDYVAGIVLILVAAVLGFVRIKERFDGGSSGWGSSLFVGTMAGLTVAIPVFVVIGLIGLVIARDFSYGSLHNAGIALFVVSGLVIFCDIKRVFDRIDRHDDDQHG